MNNWSLISTKFPFLSHISHPFLAVHSVWLNDLTIHSRLFERIFDRSYRIKRQSLSRKFIVIHIPLHISRPNLSLPSTCRPLPHCSTRTDNNEDAFYTEGIKKKKTRDTQPSRGSSSSKQRDTSNIPEAAVLFHPRHDCSSSTTVSFFFFLSFSFPFSSSLPFSFFFSSTPSLSLGHALSMFLSRN